MNLEPVMQSEVSQKEKSKYRIHMECEKNSIDETIFREGMETQIQRTDLWTQWGKESGTNGETTTHDHV